MNNRLNKKMLIILSMMVGCILIFTSCNHPRNWEKEIVITDYGDTFEHFYRNVSSTFELGDPEFEHRILIDGNEILNYYSDQEDVSIHYIYNDGLRAYRMQMDYIYCNSGENTFQLLPFDQDKTELYPVYYQLMRQGNFDVIEMLLSCGDKYAQKIALAYARNDFSEADENSLNPDSATAKFLQEDCAKWVEEYHLLDTE